MRSRWASGMVVFVLLGCSDATAPADVSFTTDATTYTGTQVQSSTALQYTVRVITRTTNRRTEPIDILSCSGGKELVYGVALVSPENVEGSGFDPYYACPGSPPIVLAAGESRVDTLTLRGPTTYDPIQKRYYGQLASRVQLVLAVNGGVRSNEFDIRIP